MSVEPISSLYIYADPEASGSRSSVFLAKLIVVENSNDILIHNLALLDSRPEPAVGLSWSLLLFKSRRGTILVLHTSVALWSLLALSCSSQDPKTRGNGWREPT